ncbi:MAG: SLC13/DASS family transporter [Altererythrobacter sp.]|nr:SLC13/DASS family transporter [Altererythrobacter sp.]
MLTPPPFLAQWLDALNLTPHQAITLAVLAGVVVTMILDRFRADVVALTGAAVLLMTRAVKPVDVQVAFASPAIIALASLFVITYAMERAGLLDLAIRGGTWLARRAGAAGIWLLMAACGTVSPFLNNTPIVVLAAPVIRDVSLGVGLDPRRYLMPLSYITVLFGCTTLIGTSTNLLVNDMARSSGAGSFGMFEIAPVGLAVALTGAAFLFLFSRRLIRFDDAEALERAAAEAEEAKTAQPEEAPAPAPPPTPAPARAMRFGTPRRSPQSATVGDASVFTPQHAFKPWRALASLTVFVAAVAAATIGIAPIAATAFAGAVLLIVIGAISADDAYRGLRPEILMLIAGMVVIGVAMEETGLAAAATGRLVDVVGHMGPLVALVVFYGAALLLTEVLSNATVAVLLTPVAVSLAEGLAVSPKPFVAAVMMAASAAFATPFGYQTNALVFTMGRYRYMDFVRVGLPLDLLTWAVACAVIPIVFPF